MSKGGGLTRRAGHKKSESFDSVTEAVSTLGLHDSSFADIPDAPSGTGGPSVTAKFTVKRAMATANAGLRAKSGPYTSSWLGNSWGMVLPRMLILWCVIVPILLMRLFIFVCIGGVFVGGVWTGMVAVAVPGSTILVYHTYRPFLAWAQDDYNFQLAWDWMAFFLSLFFNIILFTFRLMIEIWNGFCPFLALFVDLVYEIGRQLVVIFLNLPILQYMVLFFLRLFMFTVEVALDCAMTILAAFGVFLKEMTYGLTMVMIDQAQQDLRRSEQSGDRRLGPSADIYVPIGEILLHICVVFITLFMRIATALIVAFLPLISSFFQIILPMVFKYMPPIVEVLVKFFGLCTSEPVRRIFWFIISAMPIILKLMQAIACGIVPYLGSAFCYVTYGVANLMSIVLKWIIAPIVCTGFAFVAGCFRAWFYAAIGGDKCYSCGDYNTACGCEKHYQPTNKHDCSSTCHGPEGTIAVPPPVSPPTGNRSYYNVDTAGARFNDFATNPQTFADQNVSFNSGTTDNTDIVSGHVSATLDTSGQQYEECDRSVDPTCSGGGISTSTTYSLQNPESRRRRTDNSPVSGPTTAPTRAPATGYGESTSTSFSNSVESIVSVAAVYTSSPGLYAEMVVQFMSTYSVYRIGALAYRDGSQSLVCAGGVGCDLATAISALGSSIGSTPFSARGVDATIWKFSEWTQYMWMQIDLNVPSRLTSVAVTWVSDGTFLLGPSAYSMITTYVNGTQKTRQLTQSCVGQTVQRIDTVSITDDPVVSVRIEFNTSSKCSAVNYYTGPFQIRNFRVSGFPQSNYTISDLRTSSALRAHAAVRSTGALTWDPCASGRPQRVFDGRREYPSIFWATQSNASVGIQLHLTNSDNAQVDAWLSTVVVHLAATNYLPADSVRLCTSDVSNWTNALTDSSCVAAYEPTNYDSLWSSSAYNVLSQYTQHTDTEKANGWVNAPFWDANYTERTPWPMRGGHLKFNVNKYTTNSTVVLWLGPSALASTRATTWDLALVETGMHTAYFSAAQWRLGVEAALTSDGKTANQAQFSSIYCDDALDSLVTSLDTLPIVNLSTYDSPFGSSSTTRQWVGITEIDMRGSVIAHSSGRRLMGHEAAPKEPVVPGHGSTESKRADLEQHIRSVDRAAGLIPDNHLYGVDQVMMLRGASTFKHGVSDSAEGHRVRYLQSRSAPDNGQEHPFHSDLRLMPDPDEEPQFDCLSYQRDGVDRLKCHVRALSALNEPSNNEPSETSTVQKLFEDHAHLSAQLTATESAIAQRAFLRNVQVSKQLVVSQSRRLMGAEPPFSASSLNPWEAVKDNVMDAIGSALHSFEAALASAMQCGSYCIPAYFCTDSSSLSQCIPASIQFVTAKLFMCDSNQSIYDCTIGRLYRFVMEALAMLLDYILQLMDLVGEGLSHIIPHIGDTVKIIACWACSLTTIATGVLADFIDDFSLSTCQNIVDIGTSQCGRWGMGTIGEVGSAIFDNFMPLMRVLFGIIQVLPALADLCIEFAILLFGNLFEIFPQLIGDAYVLIMWLQSGSGVVGTLETLFEACDIIIRQAVDESTSTSSTNGWPSFTTAAVWDQSNSDDSELDEPVFITDSMGAGQCYQAAATPSGTGCNTNAIATDAAGRSALSANISSRANDFDESKSGSPTEFDLGGCGCIVSRPACYDGSGTGNCPYKDSTANVARQSVADSVINQTIHGHPDDTDSWPQCADVNPQTINLDTGSVYGTDSGELQRVPIMAKKCILLYRNATAGGKAFNDMALQSVISKNLNPGKPEPWWPFQTFSREDGNLTKSTDSDYYTAQFPEKALYSPSFSETFRRRSSSTRRILENRAIMGVSHFYSDVSEEESQQARDTVRKMIFESNSSYASLQVQGIRDLLREADHKIRGALMGSELPSTEHVQKTGKYVMAHARKLLGLGLSKSDFTDLACGFSSIDGSPPNTYPCAKHLWCAIPPPFPRAIRFEKEFISWKAGWKEDTLCPELDSYGNAYLFALRAVAKSAKTLAAKMVNVWPWDAVIEAFWSFASFPDDTWPQSKLHSEGWDVYYQLLCIGLNAGPFVVIFLIFVTAVLTGPVWTEAGICSYIIISDTWGHYGEQEVEIDRHKRERKEAIYNQSNS